MRKPGVLLVLLFPLALANHLEAGDRQVDGRKALKLLAECRKPSDPYDMVCVDRWLGICARARREGLSPALDAEAAYYMGIAWGSVPKKGCSCCEQPFLYLGDGPKKMEAFCLREALTVKPDYVPARERLVKGALLDGNTIEALTLATEGVRLSPNDPAAHGALGLASASAQRWTAAVGAYSTAASLMSEPDMRARYLVQAADAGWSANEPREKLLSTYQTAARLAPKWAKPQVEAAFLLAVLGRSQEAKLWFEQAVRIQPSYFNGMPRDHPIRQAYEELVLGLVSTPKAKPERQATPRYSTGSGFFVTVDGLFVTNQHVVGDAERLSVRVGKEFHPAQLVRVDASNDLAILQVGPTAGQSPKAFKALPVGGTSGLRLGASVITVGFPNPDMQGLEPKLTKGDVSSLAGIQDDPRHFQISVPIQPGNSGGPLVDMRGNVVGVVVSRLADAAAFEATGSVPQNVNYAVKSSYLIALLESLPSAAGGLLPATSAVRSTEQLGVTLVDAIGLVIAEAPERRH